MFKVNEYFNGKVISIAFQGKDTSATSGVISPGEYEFSTNKKEIMTVTSGVLLVKLKNELDYKPYKPYESFTVPQGETFYVKSSEDVAYICLYY